MPYSHRQHNPFTPVALVVLLVLIMGGLLTLPRGADPGPMVVPVMVLIIVAAATALFSRLTTEVQSGVVSWHFGFGFPRGHVAASEIDHAALTTTNLMEGWGIHWTIWHGWVWNVRGFQAVQIFKRDGKSITIGTDDPQGFLDAINAAKV